MGDANRDNQLHYQRLLTNAILGGNNGRVQDLFRQGRVDVNYIDRQDDGCTPLHNACYGARLNVVRTLIGFGADVNARKDFGETPLHVACKCDGEDDIVDMDVVRLLVEHGANPIDVAWVHLADSDRFLELLEFLLDHGADVNSLGVGSTALHKAFFAGDGLEVAKFFLDRGANLHLVDGRGCTPLHIACQFGNLERVQLLKERGADDLHVQDFYGMTPLHFACRGWWVQSTTLCHTDEYLKTIKFLIENGADIHAEDDYGYTPLHCACRSNHLEVVKLLLSKHASLKAESNEGSTPLQVACKQNRQEIVWWLVRHYPWLVMEKSE